MSAKNRQQVFLLGLLLLLLAAVSTALVFTLLRQQSHSNSAATSPNAIESEPLTSTASVMGSPIAAITPEAHAEVVAELEAARMLAAEGQRRSEAQQAAMTELNQRLQREDQARREAEQQATDLRARLDNLASEMTALESRREQLIEEQKRIEAERAADPVVRQQMDAESQRLKQLADRRSALEVEVAQAEERRIQTLKQQIETEDAIVERGGSLTIRAPHDRRREAIRLRDQMRQTTHSEE